MLRKAYAPAATALILGLGACQDLPTAPVKPTTPSDLLDLTRSDARGIVGGGKKDSPYVCFTSERATSDVRRYEYGRLVVRFPQSAIAADGSTRLYRYILLEEGAQVGAEPLGAANCRIPDTEEAVEIMNRRLGVAKDRQAKVDKDGVVSIQSCIQTICPLEGIVAIGYRTGSSSGWGSGWGTGGGGGGGGDASYVDDGYYGGSWDPGSPDDPDPCETGDAFLDSQAVQQGMDQMWQQSNFTANLADRKEKFGWVVDTGSGYRIDIVGTGTFCGWDGTAPYPPEGAGAIKGFIHTHPYSVGDPVPYCDVNGNVVGAEVYDGQPSTPDRDLSVYLGNKLGRGEPLAGLILDADGIRVFKGYDTSIKGDIPRCGY